MIENGAAHYLSWKDGEPPQSRGTGGGDGGKSAARGSFGSWKPRRRRYQDVQNELAVQLANLPRFTAYASIQGEQHQ